MVLSPKEVGRLIAAAPNLKHQAAMSVAYGAGLRVSELGALKVSDFDGQRMTLRVEQGKGRTEPSLCAGGVAQALTEPVVWQCRAEVQLC